MTLERSDEADVLVVGGGLAGLVAAVEAVDAGRRVILLEQEPAQSLGGQAFWSFGGLFFVNSPEQRRMRIRDSRELAWADWLGTAGFDREEDHWPRRWAEAYVDFAAGEKRAWLHAQGVRFFPVVGWAERGGWGAGGPGNSVPRFHVTWGTGPAVIDPFVRRLRAAVESGRASLLFRHRVSELRREGGALVARGEVLAPSDAPRGAPSTRGAAGAFELRAGAVVLAAGGIGANLELVRAAWPARLGTPPTRMLRGVPDHVDGRMLGAAEAFGGRVINRDRMWHYTEGIENHSPIWTGHGIRILPGPSSLWIDAEGNRLPVPLFPGFDTLGTLTHLRSTGHDWSWLVLTQKIIEKEFALSGSEQNPDLTGKSIRMTLGRVHRKGAPAPVDAFMRKGADFIVEHRLPDLVRRMNALVGRPMVDAGALERMMTERDRQLDNPFAKDLQVTAIRGARSYLGDRLVRVARPHKLLDPACGPLIAVRLHILTRKTLGGLETDLNARVLGTDGQPVPGLFAAGEIAGFGGGGMHGYRALEGTFLGGCLFSGRVAGRAAGS